MKRALNISLTLACAVFLAFFAVPALAQESTSIDIPPSVSSPETSDKAPMEQNLYPTLRLTPDKSELIRLDKEAASIIVGNPAHLSVLAENSKTLVLVPRMPGATYFSVLDEKGGLIMQRHVIVAAPTDKYMRIRRSCASAGKKGCQDTQVYYCPDMCHEINIPGSDSPPADSSEPAKADKNAGSNSTDTPAPADKPPPEEAQ